MECVAGTPHIVVFVLERQSIFNHRRSSRGHNGFLNPDSMALFVESQSKTVIFRSRKHIINNYK